MHLNANWLDGTDFGVYVLCPESRVADWEGTQEFTALEEYVSTIVLPGHGEILTIGGEALPVTYVPDYLTFVQNIGSDEGIDLPAEVARTMDARGWQDTVEISLGGRYGLVDALVPAAGTEEEYVLWVEIPDGHYRVQSLDLDLPLGEFRLHRLTSA